MNNVIQFSRPPEVDTGCFAANISGAIHGSTAGESDTALAIYVDRFFGSEHFTDGTVHLAVTQPDSLHSYPACSITLTPTQARDLALCLLRK